MKGSIAPKESTRLHRLPGPVLECQLHRSSFPSRHTTAHEFRCPTRGRAPDPLNNRVHLGPFVRSSTSTASPDPLYNRVHFVQSSTSILCANRVHLGWRGLKLSKAGCPLRITPAPNLLSFRALAQVSSSADATSSLSESAF